MLRFDHKHSLYFTIFVLTIGALVSSLAHFFPWAGRHEFIGPVIFAIAVVAYGMKRKFKGNDLYTSFFWITFITGIFTIMIDLF